MPGYWHAVGAAPPGICPAGQAVVVDPWASGENGCGGRASPFRPHLYCQPQEATNPWMCMANAMP